MTRSRIVQVIPLIVVNRGPYSSRLGSTWYYAMDEALDQALANLDQEAFTSQWQPDAFDANLNKTKKIP